MTSNTDSPYDPLLRTTDRRAVELQRRKNVHRDNSDAAILPEGNTGYLSANDLSLRWRCSRSQAYRIARRENLTRVCLGTGRNGMVRFLRVEVEAAEKRHIVQ